MTDNEKENTLTIKVGQGIRSDYPDHWAWEIYGDELNERWGLADSQLTAYEQAQLHLVAFSGDLGNQVDQEITVDPVDTAIDLYIGRGIIASYPDDWAWELCSVYNGYSWGTASTLHEAVSGAQQRFRELKRDILEFIPPVSAKKHRPAGEIEPDFT